MRTRRVYNLSDVEPPPEISAGLARSPKTHRVGTQTVSPGGSIVVPADVPLREISGLLRSGVLALDKKPMWYDLAKAKASIESVEAETSEVIEAEEVPKRRKRKKKS
jgi:hypothetical protein